MGYNILFNLSHECFKQAVSWWKTAIQILYRTPVILPKANIRLKLANFSQKIICYLISVWEVLNKILRESLISKKLPPRERKVHLIIKYLNNWKQNHLYRLSCTIKEMLWVLSFLKALHNSLMDWSKSHWIPHTYMKCWLLLHTNF